MIRVGIIGYGYWGPNLVRNFAETQGAIVAGVADLDSKKLAPLSNLSEDLTLAARSSLQEMIDWIVKTKGYTREQAYVICSVACDLRIGNVVDVPNYAVSTVLPLEIFRK